MAIPLCCSNDFQRLIICALLFIIYFHSSVPKKYLFLFFCILTLLQWSPSKDPSVLGREKIFPIPLFSSQASFSITQSFLKSTVPKLPLFMWKRYLNLLFFGGYSYQPSLDSTSFFSQYSDYYYIYCLKCYTELYYSITKQSRNTHIYKSIIKFAVPFSYNDGFLATLGTLLGKSVLKWNYVLVSGSKQIPWENEWENFSCGARRWYPHFGTVSQLKDLSPK